MREGADGEKSDEEVDEEDEGFKPVAGGESSVS
jgi:hypothetical protein